MAGRLFLIVLVSCGGQDLALDDQSQSGTRLRLVRWNAGAAKTLGIELYDTELGLHCTPTAWSTIGSATGTERFCTPVEPGGDYAWIAYTDVTCTQQIVLAPSDCEVPVYAMLVQHERLGRYSNIVRVTNVGAPTGPPSGGIYRYTHGAPIACQGPEPIPVGYSTYEVGADVSRGVAMKLGEPRGSGRIRWTYFESADGARYPAQPYDTDLNAPCTPPTDYPSEATCDVERVQATEPRIVRSELRGDDTWLVEPAVFYDHHYSGACAPRDFGIGLRCLPALGLTLTRYLDDSCTTPIAVFRKTSPPRRCWRPDQRAAAATTTPFLRLARRSAWPCGKSPRAAAVFRIPISGSAWARLPISATSSKSR